MKLRRWVIGSVVVVGVVLFSCAGLTMYVLLGKGPRGAAAYPAFRAEHASYIPFMPKVLTPGMTGVRFITRGFDGFPSPDGYVELRFILPPAEAAALEAVSAAEAAALVAKSGAPAPTGYASMIDGLETADDADSHTRLPKGFNTYILFHHNSNVGGVTINAAAGEVVYWRFDF